jgi:superfamily I DNA/RNA helicase
MLNPTQQQLEIKEAAARGDSFAVFAGAGTGKTATLKYIAQYLPVPGPKLAVAFNSRIVGDLKEAMPSTFTVKTLNGLGHSAWGRQRKRQLIVEKNKIGDLVSNFLSLPEWQTVRAQDEDGNIWACIRKFVQTLRNSQMVPNSKQYFPVIPVSRDAGEFVEDFFIDNEWNTEALSIEDMILLAETILDKSIQMGFDGVIDFDDQIYLTTTFFCKYDKYPTILCDEWQDASPMNHRQVLLCEPDQIIAVGDPKQAIYAFRGADSNSMENFIQAAEQNRNRPMGRYPLSITFRCPKKVVERQKAHYPEFTAAESNIEGEVRSLTKWTVEDLPFGAAVICRNNAPLVAMAFLLLKNCRGFTFYGTDMAKNLKSLIKKFCGFSGRKLRQADELIPREYVLKKLEEWYTEEWARLKDLKREEQLNQLNDKKACAKMICKQAETLGAAMRLCDTIFESNEPGLILTSGHRSKGFEWQHVFFLDSWRIPSKWAREAMEKGNYAPIQQENNLRYVIETRAKETLTFINFDKNEDDRSDLDD